MATKASSDISTNIDITCRKNDSFFLKATITNADSTAFDLSGYNDIIFLVVNSSSAEVRKFTNGAAGTGNSNYTNILKPGVMTRSDAAGGIIEINVKSTTTDTSGVSDVIYKNMDIPAGTYSYTLKIESSTELHTIMHGKFKVID